MKGIVLRFYCFYYPFCPYSTKDFRNLIPHRLMEHGDDVRPWRLSVKPNAGAITAYRMGKERNG